MGKYTLFGYPKSYQKHPLFFPGDEREPTKEELDYEGELIPRYFVLDSTSVKIDKARMIRSLGASDVEGFYSDRKVN